MLRTGADVVERAMPRIRTAASDIEAAASASRMDADAARGQSSALRAAMTLHNAGSLLMDLARMAMSVQLNGDVAAPPPFLSTESFLAGGAIGAGEATNAADATTSTETDAEATDPFSASGPTTTRMTPVAANAPDDSNFLAPALMYLDPARRDAAAEWARDAAVRAKRGPERPLGRRAAAAAAHTAG